MRQHVFRIGGREYQAEVKELTPERATIVIDGKEYAVDIVQLGRRQITADAVRAVPAPGPASTSAPALRPTVPQPAPASPAATVRQAPPARGEGGIAAPMPGLVLSIRVKEGGYRRGRASPAGDGGDEDGEPDHVSLRRVRSQALCARGRLHQRG